MKGGYCFGGKASGLFAGAVDSIVTQIRADHRLLSESLDRAFATVGNSKDRLDSLLVATYHLPKGVQPNKEFNKVFSGVAPMWYQQTARITRPDSLMHYYLLLSDPELEQTKERLETLCTMEVDVKDTNKPKKGKTKRLCRYLEETEQVDDEATAGFGQADTINRVDTVYVSTKKIRGHLYDFYMSELRNCRVCRLKQKEIDRYSLSYAHRQIFGVPSNGSMLDSLTVKELKKKKLVPDAQLDNLIQYFKERKENLIKKATEEQITTGGQNYYYIDSKLLP